MAEFQVVRDRLAKIATPDQVRALDRAVLGQLPPQIRDQIEDVFNPKPVQPDIKSETGRPITSIPSPLPNRPVHPEWERDEVQLRDLSAGTDDDDGALPNKEGPDSELTIRMPEGQDDLSISVRPDASDKDKAGALHNIADALQTRKDGTEGANDELIRDVGEGVLSLVPGVGNVLSVKDAYYAFQAAAKAYEKGDTTEAGLQAALGVVDAVGAIPGPGNLIKGAKEIAGLMVKSGKRLLKKNTPTPGPNSTPGLPSTGKRPEHDKPKTLSLKKSDYAPQSLSNEDARYFYNERVKIAKQRNAGIKDLKKGAADGHQIRNRERILARDLMKDRKKAEILARKYPNLTLEQLVKRAKK